MWILSGKEGLKTEKGVISSKKKKKRVWKDDSVADGMKSILSI